jgi:hypothetical protein
LFVPKPNRARPEFKIEWNTNGRGPSGGISANSVKSRGELWLSKAREFLVAALRKLAVR